MPFLFDPDEQIDTTPIMFIDRSGKINMTEIGTITAYVYDTSDLNLEEAARVANARDEEAALNLLMDFVGIDGAVLSIQ